MMPVAPSLPHYASLHAGYRADGLRSVLDDAQDHQQDHRANGCNHNGIENRYRDQRAQSDPGQQKSADDGAENADYHVAQQTVAAAADELAGEPACNQADQQEYDETRDIHDNPPDSQRSHRTCIAPI